MIEKLLCKETQALYDNKLMGHFKEKLFFFFLVFIKVTEGRLCNYKILLADSR